MTEHRMTAQARISLAAIAGGALPASHFDRRIVDAFIRAGWITDTFSPNPHTRGGGLVRFVVITESGRGKLIADHVADVGKMVLG